MKDFATEHLAVTEDMLKQLKKYKAAYIQMLQINYKNPFNKRFLHRFTTVLNPTEESSDSE